MQFAETISVESYIPFNASLPDLEASPEVIL
jgi:hypothetical protein